MTAASFVEELKMSVLLDNGCTFSIMMNDIMIHIKDCISVLKFQMKILKFHIWIVIPLFVQ